MGLFLILLLLPLLLHGCGGRQDTSGAITLGTHKVSVRPRCVTTRINNRFPAGGAIYNLNCGDTAVMIRNEELVINGKSYGRLSEGDAVHIEGGSVFIDGKQIEERAKE